MVCNDAQYSAKRRAWTVASLTNQFFNNCLDMNPSSVQQWNTFGNTQLLIPARFRRLSLPFSSCDSLLFPFGSR
jgi:hypothetical protein